LGWRPAFEVDGFRDQRKENIMKSLAATMIAIAILVLAGPAFAQGFGDHDGWFSNLGWGHMGFGGGVMVVFWGGIVLLVVLLARSFGSGGTRDAIPPSRQNPMEILQERFAKGEIDQKEYDERRRVLSEKH
jgi:putative membrane protein